MFAVLTCLTMLAAAISPVDNTGYHTAAAGYSQTYLATKYIQPGELDGRSEDYLVMLRTYLPPEQITSFELGLIELMQSVQPEKFGMGGELRARPILNPDNELFIIDARGRAENRRYDSFDASITAQNILRKRGIASGGIHRYRRARNP